MIGVDGDVSKNVLKKVNRNIYCILELFMECCKSLDYETFIEEIFPNHYSRKNLDKCISIVKELDEYTRDLYTHNLNPLQEYALFYLLEWWLDVTEYELDEVVDEKEIKTEDDRYIAKNINNIEEYKSFLFYDWDFLEESLSSNIEFYKIYGPVFEERFHINLEDYIDLMPDDKKQEYYKAKKRFKMKNIENKEMEYELLIVKQIYNSIKLRENDPVRLKNTTETQLSDDIRDIIRAKLYESNIVIEREMPSGFAKKGIGECDFYIYSYYNGIFKSIAIGENKEWGRYESQLKQLIGYMTKDVQFGFTILFNKTTQVNTVLDRRLDILKNFFVEVDGIKYFQVVGEILKMKEMKDVLVTKHENPERKGSYFRLYHFVINSNLTERQKSAIEAR